MTKTPYTIPISVLVVIYTPDLQVLLLERADAPGFWQSVTGSQHEGEALFETAKREVSEETGLDTGRYGLTEWRKENHYEIYERWRDRYAPGTTHNTEHLFSMKLQQPVPVTLSPREHTQFVWLPWKEAAEKVFSPSNAAAIRELPDRTAKKWKHH